MTVSSSGRLARTIPDLSYKPGLKRNLISRLLTALAAMFAVIAVLPLLAVAREHVSIHSAGIISISVTVIIAPLRRLVRERIRKVAA